MKPAEDLIRDILNARDYKDIVVDGEDKTYKTIVSLVHPDICDHANANTALARLNQLRQEFVEGNKYIDQAGEYTTNGFWVRRNVIGGTQEELMLSVSRVNHQRILRVNNDVLHRYVPLLQNPVSYGNSNGNGRAYMASYDISSLRAIPLSKIDTLDQVHVNWILSRILEFVMLLSANDTGYVHAGLSPDTIFVVPENHGIIVTSFYNMVAVGSKLKTIDGKYKQWYPLSVFNDKIASSYIDIELAKRTACWLLGDKSGIGNSLKKTHNEAFMSFVTKKDVDANDCYVEYRKMLGGNFEKKFHELKI